MKKMNAASTGMELAIGRLSERARRDERHSAAVARWIETHPALIDSERYRDAKERCWRFASQAWACYAKVAELRARYS